MHPLVIMMFNPAGNPFAPVLMTSIAGFPLATVLINTGMVMATIKLEGAKR